MNSLDIYQFLDDSGNPVNVKDASKEQLLKELVKAIDVIEDVRDTLTNGTMQEIYRLKLKLEKW